MSGTGRGRRLHSTMRLGRFDLALALGTPAAYALARFRFRRIPN